MTITSLQRALIGAVCLSAAAAAVQAHDIVLVPEAKGLLVRYGHAGDWQPVDERRLIDLQAYTAAGSTSDRLAVLRPDAKAKMLRLTERGTQSRLFAARYDNGFWARMPVPGSDKPFTRNTTRLMLPQATLVTNNLKFAKALVLDAKDEASFARNVGHALELVPQKNPATLAPGEELPVLVLLQGKPLADAGIEVGNLVDVVEEDKIQRFTSDASGIASVRLRAHGVQMLAVDVSRPNDGSLGDAARAIGADRILMVATFTFVRPLGVKR